MEDDEISPHHCQTAYYDLPVEIWNKILSYLKPSNIIVVQNVCPLWFDIIQHIISEGKIKSDFYVSKITYAKLVLKHNSDMCTNTAWN